MDASLYTLIGALGGVVITQVTNYFLEEKRGKNLENMKILETEENKKAELFKERRLAYTKYLEEFDHFINDPSKEASFVIGSYYTALIIASKETALLLITSLNLILDDEMGEVMACKKELFNAMQNDLGI